MDCEELIKSLWMRAEDSVRTIRKEGKEEAERIEQEIEQKIRALSEEHEKALAEASARRADHVLAEAESRVRGMRLARRKKLADRLHLLARSSLRFLRDSGYDRTFSALAAELPPLAWASVRVHPDDAGAALLSFPGAEISTDEGISGGVDATTGDGSVRVINTFEKRFERAWEDILPDLMQEYDEPV